MHFPKNIYLIPHKWYATLGWPLQNVSLNYHMTTLRADGIFWTYLIQDRDRLNSPDPLLLKQCNEINSSFLYGSSENLAIVILGVLLEFEGGGELFLMS